MTKFSLETIDPLFGELLLSVASVFSEKELYEVSDFVEATEYGLALQTFVDIIVDEQKLIPGRTLAVCEELARLMGLTKEVNLPAARTAVS